MNAAVILSGGVGSRLKEIQRPKQYYVVRGRSIISYCIETIERAACIDAYVIVADPLWQEFILEERKRLYRTLSASGSKFRQFAEPGTSRQQSILHGLLALKETADERDIVLVQDAVRPLASERLLQSCVEAAARADGAMPVLPMTDTVYYSEDGKKVDALLHRDKILAGQAPEAFAFGPYLRANAALSEAELSAVRGSSEPAIRAGMQIALIEGEKSNFKITTLEDLKQFENAMEER